MLLRFVSDRSRVEMLAIGETGKEDVTDDGFVLIKVPEEQFKTVEQLAQDMNRRTHADVLANAKEDLYNVDVVAWMSKIGSHQL